MFVLVSHASLLILYFSDGRARLRRFCFGRNLFVRNLFARACRLGSSRELWGWLLVSMRLCILAHSFMCSRCLGIGGRSFRRHYMSWRGMIFRCDRLPVY